MRSDERQRPERTRPAPGGAGGGADVAELRRSGESHVEAGLDAINRALSGNSLAFLNSTRQQGGE